MPNKPWKDAERRAAAAFGGRRNPCAGGTNRATSGDVVHDGLFIEVKYRQSHPYVRLWYETAEAAKKEGKLPVVVLQEKGRKTMFVVAPLSRHELYRIADALIVEGA